jgi:hypothetical protein
MFETEENEWSVGVLKNIFQGYLLTKEFRTRLVSFHALP